MLKSFGGKVIVLLTACGLVAALSIGAPRLVSQEKKEDAPKASEKKEGEKKVRAEPRGRLPAHYADVVTGEQREKIYAIQQKYAAQLEDLTEAIKALANDRDEEIEGILTPEQKDKVTKAAAAAKAKRKAAAEKKKAEAKESATKAPAADSKAPASPAPKKE